MLENTYTELRDRLVRALTDAYTLPDKLSFLAEVTDWHTTRRRLPEIQAELTDLRKGGFRWLPLLEQQLAEALALAPEAHAGLWLEADHSTGQLLPRVETLLRTGQALAFQGEYEANAHRIDLFVATWQGLKQEVQLAVERARASVSLVRQRLDDLSARIELVRSFATRKAESTLAFTPDEDPVFAIRASYKDQPGGDWKGLLYLTPQRIAFERDEDVKTSTGLFSSHTEHVRQAAFTAPLTALATSEQERRGFIFTDELLAIGWKPGMGLPERTCFEIEYKEGTTDFWEGVIDAFVRGKLSELAAVDADMAPVDARMQSWKTFLDAHRPLTEGPEQAGNRVKILHDLLVHVFTADELKRFLILILQQDELVAALPAEAASPAMFFFEATMAILRRGVLDARFAQALIRERPALEERIHLDMLTMGVG